MGADTPFAIAAGIVGFVTFAAALIAAISSSFAYFYQYKQSREAVNVFLGVVNTLIGDVRAMEITMAAMPSTAEPALRDDPSDPNYNRPENVLARAADRIHVEVEGANIRLRQEMVNNGFAWDEEKQALDPPAGQRLAWITSNQVLLGRLRERAALTQNMTFIMLQLLHTRVGFLESKLSNLKDSGRIAPVDLGQITRLIQPLEDDFANFRKELDAGSIKHDLQQLRERMPAEGLWGRIEKLVQSSNEAIRKEMDEKISARLPPQDLWDRIENLVQSSTKEILIAMPPKP